MRKNDLYESALQPILGTQWAVLNSSKGPSLTPRTAQSLSRRTATSSDPYGKPTTLNAASFFFLSNVSRLRTSLRDCDTLHPSDLQEILELAHEVYRQAVERHVRALNAERERLRRAVNDQRRELERIPERLWMDRTAGMEEQVDRIKMLMLQVRRLGEAGGRLRARAAGEE